MAARFGAPTAGRLARVLAVEADPERLEAVSEAIVRCATGDEPLREVGRRWPKRATIAVAFAKGHCGIKAVRPRG